MNLSDVNLIDPSTLYILCIPDFVVLRIYCAFQKFVTTCCGVNDSGQSAGQSPFFRPNWRNRAAAPSIPLRSHPSLWRIHGMPPDVRVAQYPAACWYQRSQRLRCVFRESADAEIGYSEPRVELRAVNHGKTRNAAAASRIIHWTSPRRRLRFPSN